MGFSQKFLPSYMYVRAFYLVLLCKRWYAVLVKFFYKCKTESNLCMPKPGTAETVGQLLSFTLGKERNCYTFQKDLQWVDDLGH